MPTFFQRQERAATLTPRFEVDGWSPTEGVPTDVSGIVSFNPEHDPEQATQVNSGNLKLFLAASYKALAETFKIGDTITFEGTSYEIIEVDARAVRPGLYPIRFEARRSS